MPYALIGGGSKGIGLAIAHALAKRGYNPILVARHLDKLEEAKYFLEKQYNILMKRIAVKWLTCLQLILKIR
jgi:short-subunit dehydrogenase